MTEEIQAFDVRSIPLDDLSIEDINYLKEKLESSVKSKRKELLTLARKAVQRTEKEYGFTIDEILGHKIPKYHTANVVPPKYRDPEVGSNVWTGRGRKPVWVDAALASGYTLEQMLITND